MGFLQPKVILALKYRYILDIHVFQVVPLFRGVVTKKILLDDIFLHTAVTIKKFHLLQMTSTPLLGAALFGVGRIGQVHLKNMVDNARLRVRWLVDVTSQHDLMTRLIDRYRLTGEAKVLDIEDSDKVFSDPG